MAVFITSTGTNVGKTMIAAWISCHTQFSYYKPIQTGPKEDSDTKTVQNLGGTIAYTPTFLFEAPLAPYLAARLEQKTIDPKCIHINPHSPIILEGAGGVLVPLNENYLMIDLIRDLHIPVLVVASSKLGTINHTCLTIEALRSRSIPIMGVVMNGPLNEENEKAIAHYGGTNVLASFPQLEIINKKSLQNINMPPLLKEKIISSTFEYYGKI